MKKFNSKFIFAISLFLICISVALCCFLFSYAITNINNIFATTPYRLFLLPLVLFSILQLEKIDKSGFSVLVSSLFSHIAGASCGKEGSGVAFSAQLGTILLDAPGSFCKTKPSFKIAGISLAKGCAFASLFLAPVSGIIFALGDFYHSVSKCENADKKVLSILKRYPFELMLIVFVTPFSVVFSHLFGAHAIRKNCNNLDVRLFLNWEIYIAIVTLLIICPFVLYLFKSLVQKVEKFASKSKAEPLLLSFLILLISLLYYGINLKSDVFALSLPLLDNAFDGNDVLSDFIFKFLLTILSLGAGFRGGNVVPSIIISSCLGNIVASIFSLPSSAFASIGASVYLSAFFASPFLSCALCCELFGPGLILLYLPLSLVSYFLYRYLF